MKYPIDRILLLLAASDLEPSEIAAALRAIKDIHPKEAISRIDEIRRVARDITRGVPAGRAEGGRYDEQSHEDALNRIDRLLRNEVGLTVAQASEAMMRALSEDLGPDMLKVGPPNREAFSKWLRRLIRFAPPRMLLHYATQIRNTAFHEESQDDWPLRTRSGRK